MRKSCFAGHTCILSTRSPEWKPGPSPSARGPRKPISIDLFSFLAFFFSRRTETRLFPRENSSLGPGRRTPGSCVILAKQLLGGLISVLALPSGSFSKGREEEEIYWQRTNDLLCTRKEARARVDDEFMHHRHHLILCVGCVPRGERRNRART